MDEREINRAMSTFALAVDAFIETQGMMAENEKCKSLREVPAYNQCQFDCVREKMQNRITELWR